MTNTITPDQIRQAAAQAFEECKSVTGGQNASYIPYLADVPSSLFGLSVTLPDGTQFNFGDSEYLFGVESISKVFTAILILKQYGAGEVLRYIGADATGLPFNSIFAILLEQDRPSTPLVNSGAITACSMVEPKGDSWGKWEAIIENFATLCGTRPEVIDDLYKSESETNFTNRAIAWLLKSYNRIYDDVPMSLDLYTRQCSIGVDTRMLSVCAATIAGGGVHPITKQLVFPADLSPKITSLISTVGFYQNTGDWLYNSGVPAKSGVGGGVMAVLPGIMGIAAFAPPLDSAGNSVKAQAVVKALVEKLDLGIFATHSTVLNS